MRVALYARVSTERQERERTIGSQVEALQARAAAEGWVVELSCADDGYSGARLDRPGLDQVRDAAAAGRIDAVVALCPDRLARNYVHQALVLEELARFGVPVIFLEGGHSDDPQGRLLAQIQAAVAEFERTKIVDRNRRGKLWRARQGEVVSGAVPYAYRKVRVAAGQPGRVEVCEQEAAVVRQAFDWHANDGLSIRQIAIRLIEAQIPSPRGNKIWHPATVDALLRQEAYAGTLYYNRRITRADGPRLPRHSAEHQPLTQSLAARGVDRHRSAAPGGPRHLVPFASAAQPQRPLQPAPCRPRTLPAASSGPLRRVRAGTPGTPKSQGERGIPLLPLLPLHHGAADAPAGREAALLTTLRPRRRARRARLERGRPPPRQP